MNQLVRIFQKSCLSRTEDRQADEFTPTLYDNLQQQNKNNKEKNLRNCTVVTRLIRNFR